MQELHSLSDAQQWFLENRDDAVICVKTVEHKCTTYPEAKAFFDTSNVSKSALDKLKQMPGWALTYDQAREKWFVWMPAALDPETNLSFFFSDDPDEAINEAFDFFNP